MNQNPFGNNLFGGQNPFDQLFGQRGQNSRKPRGENPGEGPEGGKEPERFDSAGRPVRKKPWAKGPAFALLVLFLVYAGMNSYYMLDEENYAVVTTLGSAQAQTQAGLHFKVPFIQRVRRVSKGIKGMPIGYDVESGDTIDEESIMITKDFNFVNTDFYLEYMVSDPVKYLYASVDPEATLKMLAQSYIRDTVGIYNVDDVITTGKAMIQSEIKEKLTNRMIQDRTCSSFGIGGRYLRLQDHKGSTAADRRIGIHTVPGAQTASERRVSGNIRQGDRWQEQTLL